MKRKKWHIIPYKHRLPEKFRSDQYIHFETRQDGQMILVYYNYYPVRKNSVVGRVIQVERSCQIQFCSETERWKIYGSYDRPISLYCGEWFEIRFGKLHISCRIDGDGNGLVIFGQGIYGNPSCHLHPQTHSP
jgi:hypothetical protein